jgi:hypothetical protein
LAALCAGELTELATVDEISCGLFWACELVNDVPRADPWMRAAADRMERSNVVAAFCRAHYSSLDQASRLEVGFPYELLRGPQGQLVYGDLEPQIDLPSTAPYRWQ